MPVAPATASPQYQLFFDCQRDSVAAALAQGQQLEAIGENLLPEDLLRKVGEFNDAKPRAKMPTPSEARALADGAWDSIVTELFAETIQQAARNGMHEVCLCPYIFFPKIRELLPGDPAELMPLMSKSSETSPQYHPMNFPTLAANLSDAFSRFGFFVKWSYDDSAINDGKLYLEVKWGCEDADPNEVETSPSVRRARVGPPILSFFRAGRHLCPEDAPECWALMGLEVPAEGIAREELVRGGGLNEVRQALLARERLNEVPRELAREEERED